MLATVGAAWFAPRPVIAAISLIAVAACAFPWRSPWLLLGQPTMLVVFALLAQGKDRLPHPLPPETPGTTTLSRCRRLVRCSHINVVLLSLWGQRRWDSVVVGRRWVRRGGC